VESILSDLNNERILMIRKLMLAKINWTFFVKEEQFEDNIQQLIQVIETEIVTRKNSPATGALIIMTRIMLPYYCSSNTECIETEEEAFAALNNHAPGIERPELESLESQLTANANCEHTRRESINCDFWEVHFSGRDEVGSSNNLTKKHMSSF
jgi:hypothetical protein